ncbi:AfsR/SARP family transcriptional regulator [Myceligenerans crystallogenes]|uniref:BTAD domain-containing putative transcriptional regulator n=1 Tax=Myceligenerans crystallogenes TaxID=316335 RepID=A0ABN2N4X8_9MICO
MTDVRIQLLGPLVVDVDGRRIDVVGRRPLAVLAVLALSAGETVPTEVLAERVWDPDGLPARPRSALQTYVARLRAALGGGVIESRAGGYRLSPERADVDAVRFGTLAARETDASAADRRAALAGAIALWRGEPFPDGRSEWLAGPARDRLTGQYLDVLEEAADLDHVAGRPGELLDRLREQGERHPFRESLWLRLVRALAGNGRQAEAVAEYERFRRRLSEDLGVDPAPELRELHASLLRGDRVLRAARTGRARVIPRELPADSTGFTGRADLLRTLDAGLAADDRTHPVVTVLHGPGAVGKTAVAVHWSHGVENEFPDGTLYVNLRGFDPAARVRPTDALARLLGSLGVPAREIPGDLDGAAALFRSVLQDRRILILLDNAYEAEQVRPLLPASGAHVLVTSRNRMRSLTARGEARDLAVRPLEASDGVALLRACLDEEFAAPGHGPALAALAGIADGYPLAVRLIAEHVRDQRDEGADCATALAATLRDLGGEVQRLARLDLDGDPRTDLRAVFSWSYGSLDADAARAFRLSALSPTCSFGVPAAASLAGTSERQTARRIARLTDLSLLESSAPGRHEMHDLVRGYGREAVRSGDERTAALRRLTSWASHGAHAASVATDPTLVLDEVTTSPEPGVVVERFTGTEPAREWVLLEGPGLIQVAEFGLGQAELRAAAAVLVARLFPYLLDFEPPMTGARLQARALDAAREHGHDVLEAALLNELGNSSLRLQAVRQAEAHFVRARSIYLRLGVDSGVVAATQNLSHAYRRAGRNDLALPAALESVEVARRIGSVREARSWYHLAHVHLGVRDLAAALEAIDAAIARFDELGAERASGFARIVRAEILTGLGRLHEARPVLEHARELAGSIRWPWVTVEILRRLGDLELAEGRTEQAITTWRETLELVDSGAAIDARSLHRQDLLDRLLRAGAGTMS